MLAPDRPEIARLDHNELGPDRSEAKVSENSARNAHAESRQLDHCRPIASHGRRTPIGNLRHYLEQALFADVRTVLNRVEGTVFATKQRDGMFSEYNLDHRARFDLTYFFDGVPIVWVHAGSSSLLAQSSGFFESRRCTRYLTHGDAPPGLTLASSWVTRRSASSPGSERGRFALGFVIALRR